MSLLLEQETSVEISPTLLEMIAQGKCTLFAGPLISAAPYDCLGPPTPAWLAFEMAERMQIEPERYDLPWVSQLYADRESRNALRTWVAMRLSNVRYCPTVAQHLLAQLPFPRIVYTGQDRLLRLAHEINRVPGSVILPGGSRSYALQRPLIQLYGSAEHPETLKLTEDERRRVWRDDDGLGEDLRSWARSEVLLFLGYAVNDPELSDFYYHLRPQDPLDMPRAYMVGPGGGADYVKYWEQHNVTLYSLDAAAFLKQLAQELNVQVNLPCEGPPALDAQERSCRDHLIGRFDYLFRLNGYVETGSELGRRFDQHVLTEIRAWMGAPADRRDVDTHSPVDDARPESLSKLKDGNIEWSQGNLESAREYFEAALRQNPQLIDAYLGLFHLLVEKRDLEDALQVYRDMLKEDPRQAFLPERYEVRKILGRNDLGVNYCVFDREEERLLTATVLRRTYAVREEDLERFASQMSKLSSPRISSFLRKNRHRGRLYMLSEYMEGKSLRQYLLERKPLPYSEAMQIAGQIAEALEDGHSQGVPHLHLQPSNILLSPEGVKLVNYGFARLTPYARNSVQLADGDSTDYVSPEQLAGQEGDERSDIYALGTILYEMLTGHTPGVGSFQYPSEVSLEATEAVDVLIDHARERYPDQRFASVRDLYIEIRRIALSSFGTWVGQYVRAGLSWVSRLYERLTRRKYRLLVLPGFALLLFLTVPLSTPLLLRAAVRLTLPLLLFSLPVSILIDWAVRATARRKGLGSLITSGRGMGAILGLLFALNLMFLVGLQGLFRDPEILSVFASMFALVLFESVLALGIILSSAWVTERLLKSYTLGFYWGFLAIVILEIVLTLLGQPRGMYTL